MSEVIRSQKVGFWVLFLIVIQLLLGFFLARTLKLSQVIALWMRTKGTHSEFRCDPWGQGQRGLYKHTHVTYQIKGNEE